MLKRRGRLPKSPEILDWQAAPVRAQRRVRASLWPAVQAALAAALAWYVAHDVLEHPQPFFAPIAAAITVSISYTQRARRAVQMVIGVLLGIAVAELLVAVLGTTTLALGLIVLVTLLIARALGEGFVGEGTLFANQAAASAVLVVVLNRHGTGAERAIDAVVGAAAALVIGVLLFPSAPLPRLRDAERAVLRALAGALEHVAPLLRSDARPDPGWTLATGYEIHRQLERLAQARAAASATVRIAPRRWHLRGAVAAEDERVARLDLLANAVLSLVRAATGAHDDQERLPAELEDRIAALASAITRLASTPQPWPPELVRDVELVAAGAIEQAAAQPVDRAPVVASIMRATARDLLAIVEANASPSVTGEHARTRLDGRPSSGARSTR